MTEAGYLWLLPLLPLGVWLGKWAAGKVSSFVFERTIVLVLLLTAFLLIFT